MLRCGAALGQKAGPVFLGLSQISGVDGWSGMAANFALRFGGTPMILSAIAEKLKCRSKDDFKGRHFEASLILQAVAWYLRYPLSYRDIEELFRERGLGGDPSTLTRGVLAYAPLIERRLRAFRKPHCGSIRVDARGLKRYCGCVRASALRALGRCANRTNCSRSASVSRRLTKRENQGRASPSC